MFFLIVVTHQRRPVFAVPECLAGLRRALAQTKSEKPFEITAAVVLPDHLHFIWELPLGDADFSSRVGLMKALFTRAQATPGLRDPAATWSRRKHRESTVWQAQVLGAHDSRRG